MYHPVADGGPSRFRTRTGMTRGVGPWTGEDHLWHRRRPWQRLYPSVPPHGDCKRFDIPAGLVPISAFLEVRPTDDSRPYAGGARPVLTAWLRLTEDDRPPGLYRLIMLMDALAPSYAAILTAPQPVPTVELTVRCADDLLRSIPMDSPSRVNHLGVGGWLAEGAPGCLGSGQNASGRRPTSYGRSAVLLRQRQPASEIP